MDTKEKRGCSLLLRRDVLCLVLGCSLGVNITLFVFLSTGTEIKKTPRNPTPYISTPRYLCPFFRGGLGNLMFQYASLYGIAKSKNMNVSILKTDFLWKVFHLNVIPMEDETICRSAYQHHSGRDCAFDESSLQFPTNKDVVLSSHLQSWRYFSTVEQEIRQQFTFSQEIQNNVAEHFRKTVENIYANVVTAVTIIGIHVRRGDYLLEDKVKYGYRTAPKEYFESAMRYFRERYRFPLFLVLTNQDDKDMTWCKSNIKGSDVIYMFGNSRIIDMCILSKCDHTIMSVGTFGWWGSWLANGTTLYYKYFVTPGSELSREFSNQPNDYYYPDWIGL